MKDVTHAITMNGRVTSQVTADETQAIDLITRRLRALDGGQRFSCILWALPPDTTFERVDLDSHPQQYLQAAAESSERLIVEQRLVADGAAEQHAIGRRGTGAWTDVRWEQVVTTVRDTEVFAVDEVVHLFVHYYRHGDVPTELVRRRLSL